MDFAINQRVKQLRETLGLNQREFSLLLSLSSGYIAGIEVNLRNVNNRLIKLIVAEFGANEQWLKSGEGDMFLPKTNNAKTAQLVSLFNTLPPQYQDVIIGTIELLRKANSKK